MKITIFTNQVAGGWHPSQLDTFLGGNEESLACLSRELAKAGHEVELYLSLPGEMPWDDRAAKWEGVTIRAREFFSFTAHYEVLITCKDRMPWLRGTTADRRIHWSNDVEQKWSIGLLERIDKMVCLIPYHREQLPWLPEEKATLIALGIERPGAMPVIDRDPDLAIYNTSPDRGLATILTDWPMIRRHRPKIKLGITYGLDRLLQMGGPAGAQMAAHLGAMSQQEGIFLAGRVPTEEMWKLYCRAKYWIHTLNNPNSDLAGFSALKAKLAGCKVVIPDAFGGFRDTVTDFIPYSRWIVGLDAERGNELATHAPPPTWAEQVEKHWLPLLEGRAA